MIILIIIAGIMIFAVSYFNNSIPALLDVSSGEVSQDKINMGLIILNFPMRIKLN